MTDTAKPTPGPYSVHHTTGYGLTLRSDSKKCRFVRTPSGSIAHYTIPAEEAQANMELVYEAFETHHETNLTPRQLLERVRELEAEQAELVQFFTELANDSVVFGLDTEFGDGFSVGVKTVCDAIKAALAKRRTVFHWNNVKYRRKENDNV